MLFLTNCREKGVGSTFTPSSTSREQSYIDNNRVEVLRLILVLLSKQIYHSPASILATPTRYAQYLVQKVPRKLVLTILCSLINVIVNSPSNQAQNSGISAGIGKGITKGLNQLPYTQAWNGDEARDGLVSTSVQVLVVLLDYQSSSARDAVAESTAEPSKTNHFRYFLSKIHRPTDLKYLLDGILAVLGKRSLYIMTFVLKLGQGRS